MMSYTSYAGPLGRVWRDGRIGEPSFAFQG